MKRTLFVILLCLLTVAACVSAGAFDYTFTSSHHVVVKDNLREVIFSSGDTVTLDKSCFVQDGKFDYLVILELPEKTDGTLLIGNRECHLYEKIKYSKLASLQFVASADFDGNAQFCYRVTAGKNQSAIHQMSLIRESQKETVLYNDISLETMQGISVFGNLQKGVSYKISKTPKIGTVSVTESGEFVYSPLSDSGKDTFEYEIIDGDNDVVGCGTVKVTVEKNSSNIVMLDMENRSAHFAAVKLVESGIMADTRIAGMHFFNPTLPVNASDFVAALSLATGLSAAEETLADAAASDTLTKAKAMVAVYNLLGLDTSENGNVAFEDASSIPDWAYQQVCALNDAGIISGKTVSAAEILTKEDAAELIYAAEYAANNRKSSFWESIDVFHLFH